MISSRIRRRPASRIALSVAAAFFAGNALAQVTPDAGRLLEGTREAPEVPKGAPEFRIDGPLQGRTRKPPEKPARADLPPPTPDSEVVGTFGEKEMMGIVSQML